MYFKATRAEGLRDRFSSVDRWPMAPHSRDQMTRMANFDVGAMRLLMTSDSAVISSDRHTSKPLEFHFGVDQKRLSNGQCEKRWIRCEAQGILAKLFFQEIGLGLEWNEGRGRARIGGAMFGADDVPDAVRIPCTAREFRAIVRELMTPGGNPTRLEDFVGWPRKQIDERGGEYRAKADPHRGAPHVARLMGMVAQVEADLDEADLDDEATQSPIDLLDVVFEGGLTGFAAKLGGNGGLLDQAL
jgi:hypothetical protein